MELNDIKIQFTFNNDIENNLFSWAIASIFKKEYKEDAIANLNTNSVCIRQSKLTISDINTILSNKLTTNDVQWFIELGNNV